MKYWQILASVILAMLLFVFPFSAQAASSSSITRSAGNGIQGKDFSEQNLVLREFTNIVFKNANFSNADLRGGVFNGTLLEDTNLHGIKFSDGIAYLVKFKNVNLSDAILENAMMLRSKFDNVDVTGADFTNAILDKVEIKKLCVKASGVNSQTGVDTRKSLGCS